MNLVSTKERASTKKYQSVKAALQFILSALGLLTLTYGDFFLGLALLFVVFMPLDSKPRNKQYNRYFAANVALALITAGALERFGYFTIAFVLLAMLCSKEFRKQWQYAIMWAFGIAVLAYSGVYQDGVRSIYEIRHFIG